MYELTLKEIQIEELKMLKKTIEFLDKNDINYSLYGGTLLGAVRHKGFIPWDDDIDLIVPRPDYEKFLKLVEKQNNMLSDEYEVTSFELKNSEFPFCKTINRSIHVERESSFDNYLWIDIFPADGLPNNYMSFFNKVMTYKRRYYYRREQIHNDVKYSKNFLRKICKRFILSTIKKKDYDEITNNLISVCKKNDFSKSKYVGYLIWGDKHPGDILKKEWFDKYDIVQFEDMELKAMNCYKEYLTKRYGNYMELPPENERYAHNLIAWRESCEKE